MKLIFVYSAKRILVSTSLKDLLMAYKPTMAHFFNLRMLYDYNPPLVTLCENQPFVKSKSVENKAWVKLPYHFKQPGQTCTF